MKRLLIPACVLVASCGMMPPVFDNIAYDNMVSLHETLSFTETYCGSTEIKPMLVALQRKAQHVNTYVQNTREDVAVQTAMDIVYVQTEELMKAYQRPTTPSVAYCETKFGFMINEVGNLMVTTGDRRR